MTVYADVLFIVNWSLDLVTLYITGRLMSLSTGPLRMSISAMIGAVFAVLALVFDMKGIVYASSSVAVCALMCVCAFKNAGVFTYAASSILLFSVGSALGGAMTAVYSLGEGYTASLEGGGEGGMLVIFTAAAAALTVAAAARIAKRRLFVHKRKVTLTGLGKSRTITALSDSGSFLCDPISGRPALVVRAEAVSDIIPEQVISAALSEDVISAASALPAELLGRVRLLPASSVTGGGMLLGYRPDTVTVGEGGHRRSYDCILAITDTADFSGCDAVMPAELLI